MPASNHAKALIGAEAVDTLRNALSQDAATLSAPSTTRVCSILCVASEPVAGLALSARDDAARAGSARRGARAGARSCSTRRPCSTALPGPRRAASRRCRARARSRARSCERIELLEAHDRDVVALALVRARRRGRSRPCPSRAGRASTFFGSTLATSGMTRWNAPVASSSSVETAVGVTQQALRRHDDERLAPRAQHLPAQRVEDLRRRGQVADLDVVLGAQLQEALEARARVLRALALEAVRQEQHEAAEAVPLVFGRRR